MNSNKLLAVRNYLNHRPVKISILCVVSLSATLTCTFSILSGILIVVCYACGVLVSNVLWTKKCLNLTSFINIPHYQPLLTSPQSSSCNVCGDNSCKRQKPAKDNLPWQGLNVPKEIDQAIQDLLNKIINEFVTSWYKTFSKDEMFMLELKKNLRIAACVVLRRTLQVDIGEVVMDHLIPMGFSHVNDFVLIREQAKAEQTSLEVAAVKYLDNRLHPAAKSRQAELMYLRCLCEALSPYLLQTSEEECMNFKVLMRELLAGWVLLPLSDTLCDPFCINTLILLALSPEPLTRYPESPLQPVQFLERFVLPSKDMKKSNLSELSAVLKDTQLLYNMMQFLKKEGSVHLLQFCLHVEEFNGKILSPELTLVDMEALHREAWDLFTVYFKTESPDSIHFPKHIVIQMQQVLQGGVENITRLRTSTPLFQAYEVVYTILEETYLPRFQLSDEYFTLVYGERQPSGFMKPESRTTAKKGPADGYSAVSKLSNRFHRLLQFQAVEGSACFETPLDSVDSECTEDLYSHGDQSYRDMSAWRVTIPTVTTRQDVNSKPYPVFNLNVTDIGHKDEGDKTNPSWDIERRYTDFYILQAKLAEFHGDFEDGTQLPAKKGLFGPRGEEFLESRRQEFQEYLQKLLQKPTLRGSHLLHSFLEDQGEFPSVVSAPDGLGKMIRKSVEPMKLRKERGQHLDKFLATYLASTEGIKRSGKYEWQDVNVEPDRRQRCITRSMFRDNFQEAILVCERTEGREREYETDKLQLVGPWECLLYTMTRLMAAPLAVLQCAVTVRFLLGSSPDTIFKNLVNRKLREVLVPQRVSHLVRLLQGALFGSSYQPGKGQQERNLMQAVLSAVSRSTKRWWIKWLLPSCDEGVEAIVDTLQEPILNKHLCYCLLDDIVRVLFPELATSTPAAPAASTMPA